MKYAMLGNIEFQGGIEPDACRLMPNQVSLIVRWRSQCTAVGLEIDLSKNKFEVIWRHELTGDTYHNWAGHKIVMNAAAVIPDTENCVYITGGTSRLLLDSKLGTIIAQSVAQSSPTAGAALLEDKLIVPEGQALAAYGAKNLNLEWRKLTPENQWIFSSPVNSFVLLQNELGQTASLWNFETEALWPLPSIVYPTQAPAIFDDVIVVPSGGGSASRLIAFDLKTGSERWSLNYSRNGLKATAESCPLSRHLLIEQDKRVIVATVRPTLEAASVIDGTQLWCIKLPSEAITLALSENIIWVSTVTGHIILVDTKNGVIIDSMVLPGRPISILPILEYSASTAAIVLLQLGNVYYINS